MFGLFRRNDRAPDPQMTYQRRLDRTTDELIGLCRGILSDGEVSKSEATALLSWIDRNAMFADKYPFNVLLARLHDALRDGVFDDDEERDLVECITKLVGGEADNDFMSESASLSTELPLDDPAPPVVHDQVLFSVTGTFAYGTRTQVIAAIEERGGKMCASPSRRCRFLIVGSVGSRDWIHSSYGRKIEKALDLRAQGYKIAIVSENHWVTHVT